MESLLLSLIAGAAAIGLAWIVAGAFEGTIVLQGMAPLERAEMDWRVLGWAVLISVGVAAIAGVVPALSGSRVDVNLALRQSGRAVTPGRQRLRRLLTVAQVAGSLTLLIGAGLLVRSMNARLGISPGFDATRVLTFSIDPQLQRYGDRPTPALRELIDRVRRVPGVRAAALAFLRPSFQGIGADVDFFAEGTDGKPMLSADTNFVSPGYFQALGMPLVEGREFGDAEFRSRTVIDDSLVVMTESLARRTFGNTPAVGRHIEWAGRKGLKTVIGVVGDTKQRRLTDPSSDMIFGPLNEGYQGFVSVIVGLGAPEASVVPGLRQALAEVDPTLPMYDVMRVDDAIRGEFADDYLVMRLTMAFAVLATLVAAIGLYGVLARGVNERRREFGIRVALGASPAAVAGLITREAMYVLIVGLGFGIGASLWLARYLDSRLFGITHLDPVSFASAVGIIVVVMLASAVPAGRRAAGVSAAEVIK
jgi:predicted permease